MLILSSKSVNDKVRRIDTKGENEDRYVRTFCCCSWIQIRFFSWWLFSYELQIQFLTYLLFHVASSRQLEKSTIYGEYGAHEAMEKTNATAISWASLPPENWIALRFDWKICLSRWSLVGYSVLLDFILMLPQQKH
jgi:hypothetical protein